MHRRSKLFNAVQCGLITIGMVALIAACGPSGPPGGATAPAPAEAVPFNPNTAKAQLKTLMPLPVPMKWVSVESVNPTASPDSLRPGGAKAVVLTPTADSGLHRIILEANFGAPHDYRMTVWVKGQGLDALLEARGATMLPSGPADYGVAYFDLANGAQQAQALVTSETKFPAVEIGLDGDWRKLSVDFTSGDGTVFLVIGATSGGEHVFAGAAGQTLTIGGVEIQPR